MLSLLVSPWSCSWSVGVCCWSLTVLAPCCEVGAARCARASPRRAGWSVVSPVGGVRGVGWRRPGSSPARRVALGAQEGDLGLEVVGGLEGPVDAGEPQVGDLVELAQRAEDGQADLVGGDLGAALAAQRVLDLLAEAGQVVLGDRPALAGLADAGDRLLAAERLGRAGALDHGQLHLLDGGEPLARSSGTGAGGGSPCRRRRRGSRGPGCRCGGRTGSAWFVLSCPARPGRMPRARLSLLPHPDPGAPVHGPGGILWTTRG